MHHGCTGKSVGHRNLFPRYILRQTCPPSMSRIPRHVPFYFLVTHSETWTLHFLVSESETSTIGQYQMHLETYKFCGLLSAKFTVFRVILICTKTKVWWITSILKTFPRLFVIILLNPYSWTDFSVYCIALQRFFSDIFWQTFYFLNRRLSISGCENMSSRLVQDEVYQDKQITAWVGMNREQICQGRCLHHAVVTLWMTGRG